MAFEYEILVIGGGPSGLSAATTIVRQSHKTILFDSGKYRNAEARHMHTLATWDHQDPAKFRAAARADLERYGTVTVENVEIESITRRDDGLFEARGDGKTWTGKKVILATGVEDIFPDIPGYADCWVSGVFHCLFCHGWEDTGVASSGILCMGDVAAAPPALHFARQGLRMSRQVTLYTNGNEALAKDLTAALESSPAPMTVDSRKIAKLVKGPKAAEVIVHFEDGSSTTEGFIAHKPKSRLRGNLAEQLGVEITAQNTLQTNPPFNQTNVRGVFAAGDCASPMHTVTGALNAGCAAGAAAPLQIQAETYNQEPLF
ncbi:FAD/NAD(P)-binding domain-containing protein [Xylariomycetidae sp. FL2044]|nr:FAD/NAD(P)-binding domain-containing protein [Xylariomycetidae sp. FL2044]